MSNIQGDDMSLVEKPAVGYRKIVIKLRISRTSLVCVCACVYRQLLGKYTVFP